LVAPVTYKGLTPDLYCTLIIGKWFYADKLLVKSVQPVWESMVEKDSGTPMKARCDVTLETMTVPTVDDIMDWFRRD
jgi:hypothetical protein